MIPSPIPYSQGLKSSFLTEESIRRVVEVKKEDVFVKRMYFSLLAVGLLPCVPGALPPGVMKKQARMER